MHFGVLLVVSFALVKLSVHGPCLLEPRNLTVTRIQSRVLNISWMKPENNDNYTITYDVFYKATDGSTWEKVTDLNNAKATLQVKPFRFYEIFVMTKAKGVHGVASARISTGRRTPEEEPEKCPILEDIERMGHNVGVFWREVPQEDRNGQLVSHTIFYKNCSMDKEKSVTVNITLATDYYEIVTLGPGPYTFKVIARNGKGFCKDYAKTKMVSEERFKIQKLCVSPSPVPSVSTSAQITPSQTKTQSPISTSVQATLSQATAQSYTTLHPQRMSSTPEASSSPVPSKELCPTVSLKPCHCSNTKEPDFGTKNPAKATPSQTKTQTTVSTSAKARGRTQRNAKQPQSLSWILASQEKGACLLEPRNLTVTSFQSRVLKISWVKPENNDNHTITYDVFYKATDGSTWEKVSDLNNTKATLQVKPFRSYEIFVMTKTKGVHGVASARISTGRRAPEEAPESCPTIKDIQRSGSSVGVWWNEVPDEDRNGPLVSHRIVYHNCSMDTEQYVTASLEQATDYYDIENLGPGPYTFKVIAINSKGFCKGYQNTKRVSEQRFKKQKLCVLPLPVPSVSTSAQATPSQTKAQPTVSTSTQITPSQTTTQSPISTSIQATLSKTTAQPQTTEPAQEPCPTSTQKPCNCPSTEEPDSGTEKPAEKLSNTDESGWLKYVAIALAVIVVLMGITIFLLIWQLYKNHRFYKLRRDQAYRMTTQEGKDNPGQDNP